MEETILNIFLEIKENRIVELAAVSHRMAGSDEEKISFLKESVFHDYEKREKFASPFGKDGKPMRYKEFEKLKKINNEWIIFDEIFKYFLTPSEPLICVTPVIDGKINK